MTHPAQDLLATVGTWLQYAGAGAAVVLSFLNANAAAFGVIIGLCGLLMNYHFKRKAHKLLAARYPEVDALND
jgi:hypothetical protein